MPPKVRTVLQQALPQLNWGSGALQESQVWISALSSFPPKSIPEGLSVDVYFPYLCYS